MNVVGLPAVTVPSSSPAARVHSVGKVTAGSPTTFTSEVHGVYWHWRM